MNRGFRLPASHVIHTVGPIYDSDKNPEAALRNAYRYLVELCQYPLIMICKLNFWNAEFVFVLCKTCYRNSLRVAKEHNIQYIAFTAISCGVYGYEYYRLNETVNSCITSRSPFIIIYINIICLAKFATYTYKLWWTMSFALWFFISTFSLLILLTYCSSRYIAYVILPIRNWIFFSFFLCRHVNVNLSLI